MATETAPRMARAESAAAVTGGSESALVRAQLQLRELILSGELPGGGRIAELAIVERLGFRARRFALH